MKREPDSPIHIDDRLMLPAMVDDAKDDRVANSNDQTIVKESGL